MNKKRYQQVIVLKCFNCKKTQGIATSKTQEQLKEPKIQRQFKMKKINCNFCQKGGELITNFKIIGITSNQEAKEIIKQKNLEQALNTQDYSLEFK